MEKKKKEYKAPTLYSVDASKKALGDCNDGPTNSGGGACISTGPSASTFCSQTGLTATGDCYYSGPSAGSYCVDTGGGDS